MANIECTMYRLPNHAASKEDGPVRTTAPRATGDPGLQVTLQDRCWWLSHSLLLTSRGCNSDLTLVESPPFPPSPPRHCSAIGFLVCAWRAVLRTR